MTKSRNLLTTAALVSLGLLATAFTVGQFNGSAEASIDGADPVSARIAAAFADLPDAGVDPALEAAAEQARKGDLLAEAACATQTWPDIAPQCLVMADGSAVDPARTVTVGYQLGESTSVLVRMPAPQVASR